LDFRAPPPGFFLAALLGDRILETNMKTIFRLLIVPIAFIVASASGNAAGVGGVDVSVKPSAGGKAIKQARTDAAGNFSLGSLPEGAYTLEFRARTSPELKKQQVTISVAGTKKSGRLDKIPGDHLVAGATLKVETVRGASVTGQITTGPRMVWIPPILGSNRPGHWVEENSAEAKASKTRSHMSNESLQKMQENAYNPQG
jgi:carboxypeptidase family protein